MLIYDNQLENVMNQINTTSIKVLFTCLLLSFTVQCCAATTVSIADITADPGDVVTVPIRIDGIEDYGTATIKLEYDSSVIFVEDITGSSDSTITAKNIYNPDPGQAETEGTQGYASISAWNIDGVSGNIVFANVTIKAVGNSGGSTTLTLTVDTLQDTSKEVPVDDISISSGSFTITGQAPADPAPTQVPPTPSANDGGASTSQTPHDDETGTSPTPAHSDGEVQPAPHDAGTDSSPPTHPSGEDEAHSTPQPAATSMAKSPSSAAPGFGGVPLVIGLLTAFLIARQRFR